MSALSPALRAQGRATYRSLLRSAAVAFRGDERVLNGFRDKARTDFTAGRSITNEEEYTAQLSHASEVAAFLRKNLIQGVNVDGSDTWKLQWREGIELGDNDTIKDALRKKSMLPPKGTRRTQPRPCASSQEASSVQAQTLLDEFDRLPEVSLAAHNTNAPPHSLRLLQPLSSPPSASLISSELTSPVVGPGLVSGTLDTKEKPIKYLSKKALHAARNSRAIPELREEDLEEKFVQGSGPGGQAINKTRSNVSLLHKPTGIRVTCQDTRSLDQNRKIARKMVIEKLDQLVNPGLSKNDVKLLLERRRKGNKKRKQLKKKKQGLENEAESGVESQDSDAISHLS